MNVSLSGFLKFKKDPQFNLLLNLQAFLNTNAVTTVTDTLL